MTPYYCPNCHAQCRTPESLGIHVSRCRAMSVEEIHDIALNAFHHIEDSRHCVDRITTAIHAHHIAKLRGRKNA